MDLIGRKWIEQDQTGPNKTKVDQIGLKWIEMGVLNHIL